MRKVCFVITSQIHYSRSKLVLSALKERGDIDLQIVVAASAILPFYGDVLSLMEKDGFACSAKITMTLEGGTPVAMAKTTGIGIIEFATVFENLKPDVVVVRGDRYEVLSSVVAAAYLNIPVAHIEGGEITGNIDESVRHAITKLAHIHLTTNELARGRVLKMGENPAYVFDVGSPELEVAEKNTHNVSQKMIDYLGVGDLIDISKEYILAMQHPVTSEIGHNRENVEQTLEAINELGIPCIWFWPNADAGTDEVSKAIRVFREKHNPHHMRFIKFLPPEDFLALLKTSACLVGNSSSAVKECSFLGVAAVNIGTRQNGRMKGENVIDVGYNKEEIKQAIKKQLKHGKYPRSDMYYKANSSEKIAEILAITPLYTQKRFFEPQS